MYDDALYTAPNDDPTAIRKPLMLGTFKIDVFEYPPQFLLLPRGLRLLAPEFLDQRMLWFALEGGVILLALLVVARFLGPTAGTRALLLSPLVWAAVPTISMLQKGNVQGAIIALSMVAMVLFERRRFALGGLLLGFATVSKLYPGLLCLYLLARRQWRAAAWTAAMGVALSVLTVVDFGWAPFSAFLQHFPGLLGGEAFPAFRNPSAMAINMSIPGLAFKLKLFGVPGMGFGAAKIIGWIYTPIALAATVVAARRLQSTPEKPLVWLAVLTLATLRSPFLPNAYGVFPALWLLTLLAATYVPRGRILGWTVAGWATLGIYWAVDWPVDPRIKALVNLLPQALMVVLAVLALRRRVPESVPVA
ncbi:MAG: glycosyltransferase family 87 protein [Acidobacteriota bacterium]